MNRAYTLGIMAAIIYTDSNGGSWTKTEALREATKILDAAESQETARIQHELEQAREARP